MLENNNPKMGFRDGLPIGIGYFAISFAVGVFAAVFGTVSQKNSGKLVTLLLSVSLGRMAQFEVYE